MKHWKSLLLGLVCVLCLLGLGWMRHGDKKTVEALTAQSAAQRWETTEKPYAMASVFLPERDAVPTDFTGSFYLAVENALTAGGVGSEDHPWYYAASYQRDAALQNGKTAVDVRLTAVAGDFFRIHPMELLSGWYMEEQDIMHDRIVLDKQTAWELFYSMNVVGETVTLAGNEYQVAAVVDTEEGTYNQLAAGDRKRAWVFADSPALAPADGAETDGEGYTCIEVVLPQPVEGFAAATLKSALGSNIPEQTLVTDNSGRFSLKNRWSILRNLTTRGISSAAIAYPEWENAARLTENHLALRLVPESILLAIPLLCLLGLLLWLNHRRTWGLHSIRDAVENAIDKKHQRDYDRRNGGELPEKQIHRTKKVR